MRVAENQLGTPWDDLIGELREEQERLTPHQRVRKSSHAAPHSLSISLGWTTLKVGATFPPGTNASSSSPRISGDEIQRGLSIGVVSTAMLTVMSGGISLLVSRWSRSLLLVSCVAAELCKRRLFRKAVVLSQFHGGVVA